MCAPLVLRGKPGNEATLLPSNIYHVLIVMQLHVSVVTSKSLMQPLILCDLMCQLSIM